MPSLVHKMAWAIVRSTSSYYLNQWLECSSSSSSSSSSSKFYFQQNTTMEQYQEKENTL